MSILENFEQKHFRGEYIGYHERDVKTLLAHARALEAMLKKHEWSGSDGDGWSTCPECGHYQDEDNGEHAPDCSLAKLLEGTNQ